MTTDLCTDDVVVHIATPQGLAAEGVGGGAGGRGAGAGGAELGRRLLLAARAGDTPAVLDLMAKGAPFTTDWLGTSPLHLAAANGHLETCAVLLRAGASRDARTKVERTPLHLAAHAGHAALVRLLLEHGAHVDCRDMLRMTPLHWAAARGHEAAARELLRRGADPLAACKFGKRPRCLALRARNPALARLLQDAAARNELARSLRHIPNSPNEEPAEQKEIETVQRIQDINPMKVKQQAEKNVKVEPKTEGGGGAGGGGGGGGAAALLRRHGIALLPTDDGSTVLSALQSGRTVVLSDAGKLMLKESGSSAAIGTPRTVAMGTTSSIVNITSSTNVTSTGNITAGVLNAKPVKAPAKAVKLFTLNNLSGLGGVPATQIRKILNPQDFQQVKIVKAAPAREQGEAARRAPVQILVARGRLERLVATAEEGSVDTLASQGEEEATDREEKECGCACGCGCASKLAAAQRALRRLKAELSAASARLALYEPPS